MCERQAGAEIELKPLPENWGGSLDLPARPDWLSDQAIRDGAKLIDAWEESADFTGYTLIVALARVLEKDLSNSKI